MRLICFFSSQIRLSVFLQSVRYIFMITLKTNKVNKGGKKDASNLQIRDEHARLCPFCHLFCLAINNKLLVYLYPGL